MKRYPKYKDSGVPWLGQVPAHWPLVRIGSQTALRSEKGSDKDFTPLSVTKLGVVPQLETAAKTDDGDNRKIVRKGDFVINGRSDRKGSSGVSAIDGSVSLINITIKLGAGFYPRFAHHLFRSYAFQEEFYRWGKGIVADLWSTNYWDLKRIMCAMPTLEEQESIAKFLDAELVEMDSAISSQERMIELLKERRSAIITQAVTKGLDPKAKMKDSGVPWLGQVPANWELKKLTHTAVESGTKNTGMVEDNLLSLSYGQIIRKDIDSNEGLLPASFEGYQIVEKGDTVLRLTDLQNDQKSLRAGFVSERGIITSAYCAVRPTAVSGPWLFNALRAADLLKVFYSMGGGVRQSLDFESIKRIEIPIPSREEQLAIDAYLIAEESRIRSAISSQERMIELLKERRSAVISQAVTGQIDVR